MTDGQTSEIFIRPATPQDAPICGQICYDAFLSINQKHGFPADFPDPGPAIGVLSMMFANPHFYCLVAEVAGRIVGSNCLDERSMINGVGPVTIDPSAQNHGVGRRLMQAVIDRARQKSAPGVRLVQAGFHTRSLSLYASLGFDVREHLVCVQGKAQQHTIAGYNVRAAQPADLEACNVLSQRVHGFDRSVELTGAIEHRTARVVEHEGRITGYASDLAFFGHGTAETNTDLQALIASTDSFGGPGLLVPSRNSALFRGCLAIGLRVVQPMTLMSMGLYSEPAGAWFPSILY